MAETGFGSPSYSPAPTFNDWGFGDPTPFDIDTEEEYIVGNDTAFGSPRVANVSAFVSGEFSELPDDGGVILEIQGKWHESGFYEPVDGVVAARALFPFAVNFIDSASGDEYPAIGEQGNNCITDYRQTKLFAGVPPLPLGVYDIKIEWLTRAIYIDNAFEVFVSPRCKQTYGIRQHLPEWFNAGPRRADSESVGEYVGGSLLANLTQAIGEGLQRLYGNPMTALSSDFEWGDAVCPVESTVGFPSEGQLFIGQTLYTYSGKTSSSFTGLVAALYHETLLERTEVHYAQRD